MGFRIMNGWPSILLCFHLRDNLAPVHYERDREAERRHGNSSLIRKTPTNKPLLRYAPESTVTVKFFAYMNRVTVRMWDHKNRVKFFLIALQENEMAFSFHQ